MNGSSWPADRIPLHGGAVLAGGKTDLWEVAHLAPVKQIALKLETKLQESKSLYFLIILLLLKPYTIVEYSIIQNLIFSAI